MWNFGIPYALKYYIDCIVQPGYLFRFNELGYPVPLVHGKRDGRASPRGAATTRPASPMHALDFQEPYLRAIFGFVGITDIEFVDVQPTDIPALRESAMATAITRAHTLHRRFVAPARKHAAVPTLGELHAYVWVMKRVTPVTLDLAVGGDLFCGILTTRAAPGMRDAAHWCTRQ